jgi:hypothetical protein
MNQKNPAREELIQVHFGFFRKEILKEKALIDVLKKDQIPISVLFETFYQAYLERFLNNNTEITGLTPDEVGAIYSYLLMDSKIKRLVKDGVFEVVQVEEDNTLVFKYTPKYVNLLNWNINAGNSDLS